MNKVITWVNPLVADVIFYVSNEVNREGSASVWDYTDELKAKAEVFSDDLTQEQAEQIVNDVYYNDDYPDENGAVYTHDLQVSIEEI